MLCNGHLSLRKLYNDSEQDSETIYAGIPRSRDICRIFSMYFFILSSPYISNLSIIFAIFPSSTSLRQKNILIFTGKSIQGQ